MTCEIACESLFSGVAGRDAEVAAHLADCPSCARLAEANAHIETGLAELQQEWPTPPPFESLSLQTKAIARAKHARRWARRILPLALAASIAAVVTVGLVLHFHSTLPRIAAGDVLTASSEARTGRLPSGARMELQGGRVTLAELKGEERLMLAGGSVSLQVPKLPRGTSLAVETPDALVRVHGTRFTVSMEEDGTQVVVTEGLVEVRPEGSGRPAFFLKPGESARVEHLASYQQKARDAAVAALDKGDLQKGEQQLQALLATEPAGELAGEAHALLAWIRREQGARDAALELYRRALDELPAGAAPAWAEDACAERAVLEQEEGRGKDAWRECLRRFPNGSHAALARQHLGGNR